MATEKTVSKQAFDELSPREREVVGNPEDYEWTEALTLPARRRPETMQFSLRIERRLFETLQAISEEHRRTFSDVARGALHDYVAGGTQPAVANVEVSYGTTQGLVEAMLVQVVGATAELSSTRSWAVALSDRPVVQLGDTSPQLSRAWAELDNDIELTGTR